MYLYTKCLWESFVVADLVIATYNVRKHYKHAANTENHRVWTWNHFIGKLLQLPKSSAFDNMCQFSHISLASFVSKPSIINCIWGELNRTHKIEERKYLKFRYRWEIDVPQSKKMNLRCLFAR